MYFSPFYTYAGATVVGGIITRVWVRFRRDRAARKAMSTPLFAPELLDQQLALNHPDDDPIILSELHSTFSHLNRRAFAEEFWNLDKDLVKYYKKIPSKSRPTMERVLINFIEGDEKWLQIVGAKTTTALKVASAVDAITKAIQNSSDDRFKTELKLCLTRLQTD